MALQAAAYENFVGGMVSSVPVNELNANQLALCRNALVTDRNKPGILKKRLGYSEHWNEPLRTVRTKAIHNYVRSDGTEFLVFESNDDIRYRASASTSTNIVSYGSIGTNVTLLTSSTDFLMIKAEDNGLHKWDGTVLTSVSGVNADATTGMLALHNGRLWTPGAGSSGPANRLYFSAVNDEDDWDTQDNAGSIDMNMSKITGIMPVGRAGLVVCDEFQTILIEGTGFQSYQQTELSTEVGCKSYQTMVSFGTFGCFLSRKGVVAVSDAGLEIVSLAVDDIIDGWTEAQFTSAAAFKDEEKYVLLYDSDEDGERDSALVFDTRLAVWVQYTNYPFSSGTRAVDNTVYVADDTKGTIYQLNDGTTDNGTDITMTVRTKGWDFGRWFARKTLRRVYFQADAPGSSYNVTVQAIIDGANVGAPQTFDVNDGESSLSLANTGVGNVLQLELTNSGTADVIEIISLLFLADMKPAGETI